MYISTLNPTRINFPLLTNLRLYHSYYAMTTEQLTDEIAKQLNAGFSSDDIKRNLVHKGVNSAEVHDLLTRLTTQQNESSVSNKVRLYSASLFVFGIILYSSLKAVYGELDFDFSSTGDLVRWRELFFQPFGALFLMATGIYLFFKRKPIRQPILKTLVITWFIIQGFLSAFSNNLVNLLVSIAVITVYVLMTNVNKK